MLRDFWQSAIFQQSSPAPYFFGGPFFLRTPSVDVLSDASILILPTGFVAMNNNPPHYLLRIYTNLDFIGKISIDGLEISALLYQRIAQTNYYYYERLTTNNTHAISAQKTSAAKFSVSYTIHV